MLKKKALHVRHRPVMSQEVPPPYGPAEQPVVDAPLGNTEVDCFGWRPLNSS